MADSAAAAASAGSRGPAAAVATSTQAAAGRGDNSAVDGTTMPSAPSAGSADLASGAGAGAAGIAAVDAVGAGGGRPPLTVHPVPTLLGRFGCFTHASVLHRRVFFQDPRAGSLFPDEHITVTLVRPNTGGADGADDDDLLSAASGATGSTASVGPGADEGSRRRSSSAASSVAGRRRSTAVKGRKRSTAADLRKSPILSTITELSSLAQARDSSVPVDSSRVSLSDDVPDVTRVCGGGPVPEAVAAVAGGGQYPLFSAADTSILSFVIPDVYAKTAGVVAVWVEVESKDAGLQRVNRFLGNVYVMDPSEAMNCARITPRAIPPGVPTRVRLEHSDATRTPQLLAALRGARVSMKVYNAYLKVVVRKRALTFLAPPREWRPLVAGNEFDGGPAFDDEWPLLEAAVDLPKLEGSVHTCKMMLKNIGGIDGAGAGAGVDGAESPTGYESPNEGIAVGTVDASGATTELNTDLAAALLVLEEKMFEGAVVSGGPPLAPSHGGSSIVVAFDCPNQDMAVMFDALGELPCVLRPVAPSPPPVAGAADAVPVSVRPVGVTMTPVLKGHEKVKAEVDSAVSATSINTRRFRIDVPRMGGPCECRLAVALDPRFGEGLTELPAEGAIVVIYDAEEVRRAKLSPLCAPMGGGTEVSMLGDAFRGLLSHTSAFSLDFFDASEAKLHASKTKPLGSIDLAASEDKARASARAPHVMAPTEAIVRLRWRDTEIVTLGASFTFYAPPHAMSMTPLAVRADGTSVVDVVFRERVPATLAEHLLVKVEAVPHQLQIDEDNAAMEAARKKEEEDKFAAEAAAVAAAKAQEELEKMDSAAAFKAQKDAEEKAKREAEELAQTEAADAERKTSDGEEDQVDGPLGPDLDRAAVSFANGGVVVGYSLRSIQLLNVKERFGRRRAEFSAQAELLNLNPKHVKSTIARIDSEEDAAIARVIRATTPALRFACPASSFTETARNDGTRRWRLSFKVAFNGQQYHDVEAPLLTPFTPPEVHSVSPNAVPAVPSSVPDDVMPRLVADVHVKGAGFVATGVASLCVRSAAMAHKPLPRPQPPEHKAEDEKGLAAAVAADSGDTPANVTAAAVAAAAAAAEAVDDEDEMWGSWMRGDVVVPLDIITRKSAVARRVAVPLPGKYVARVSLNGMDWEPQLFPFSVYADPVVDSLSLAVAPVNRAVALTIVGSGFDPVVVGDAATAAQTATDNVTVVFTDEKGARRVQPATVTPEAISEDGSTSAVKRARVSCMTPLIQETGTVMVGVSLNGGEHTTAPVAIKFFGEPHVVDVSPSVASSSGGTPIELRCTGTLPRATAKVRFSVVDESAAAGGDAGETDATWHVDVDAVCSDGVVRCSTPAVSLVEAEVKKKGVVGKLFSSSKAPTRTLRVSLCVDGVTFIPSAFSLLAAVPPEVVSVEPSVVNVHGGCTVQVTGANIVSTKDIAVRLATMSLGEDATSQDALEDAAPLRRTIDVTERVTRVNETTLKFRMPDLGEANAGLWTVEISVNGADFSRSGVALLALRTPRFLDIVPSQCVTTGMRTGAIVGTNLVAWSKHPIACVTERMSVAELECETPQGVVVGNVLEDYQVKNNSVSAAIVAEEAAGAQALGTADGSLALSRAIGSLHAVRLRQFRSAARAVAKALDEAAALKSMTMSAAVPAAPSGKAGNATIRTHATSLPGYHGGGGAGDADGTPDKLEFMFVPLPKVIEVDAVSGPAAGQTHVRITGRDLVPGTDAPLRIRLVAPATAPPRGKGRKESSDASKAPAVVFESHLGIIASPRDADGNRHEADVDVVTATIGGLEREGKFHVQLSTSEHDSSFVGTGFSFVGYGPHNFTSMEPPLGPATGGTAVTLRGDGFMDTGAIRIRYRFDQALRTVSDDEDTAGHAPAALDAAGTVARTHEDVTVSFVSSTELSFKSVETHDTTIVRVPLEVSFNGRDFAPLELLAEDAKPATRGTWRYFTPSVVKSIVPDCGALTGGSHMSVMATGIPAKVNARVMVRFTHTHHGKLGRSWIVPGQIAGRQADKVRDTYADEIAALTEKRRKSHDDLLQAILDSKIKAIERRRDEEVEALQDVARLHGDIMCTTPNFEELILDDSDIGIGFQFQVALSYNGGADWMEPVLSSTKAACTFYAYPQPTVTEVKFDKSGSKLLLTGTFPVLVGRVGGGATVHNDTSMAAAALEDDQVADESAAAAAAAVAAADEAKAAAAEAVKAESDGGGADETKQGEGGREAGPEVQLGDRSGPGPAPIIRLLSSYLGEVRREARISDVSSPGIGGVMNKVRKLGGAKAKLTHGSRGTSMSCEWPYAAARGHTLLSYSINGEDFHLVDFTITAPEPPRFLRMHPASGLVSGGDCDVVIDGLNFRKEDSVLVRLMFPELGGSDVASADADGGEDERKLGGDGGRGGDGADYDLEDAEDADAAAARAARKKRYLDVVAKFSASDRLVLDIPSLPPELRHRIANTTGEKAGTASAKVLFSVDTSKRLPEIVPLNKEVLKAGALAATSQLNKADEEAGKAPGMTFQFAAKLKTRMDTVKELAHTHADEQRDASDASAVQTGDASPIDDLGTLTIDDLRTIVTLKRPPDQVTIQVLCAVVLLLKEEPTWKSAKKVMREPDFIKRLRNLNPSSLPRKSLSTVKKLVKTSNLAVASATSEFRLVRILGRFVAYVAVSASRAKKMAAAMDRANAFVEAAQSSGRTHMHAGAARKADLLIVGARESHQMAAQPMVDGYVQTALEYRFLQQPSLTGVEPRSCLRAGGTSVRIVGSGLSAHNGQMVTCHFYDADSGIDEQIVGAVHRDIIVVNTPQCVKTTTQMTVTVSLTGGEFCEGSVELSVVPKVRDAGSKGDAAAAAVEDAKEASRAIGPQFASLSVDRGPRTGRTRVDVFGSGYLSALGGRELTPADIVVYLRLVQSDGQFRGTVAKVKSDSKVSFVTPALDTTEQVSVVVWYAFQSKGASTPDDAAFLPTNLVFHYREVPTILTVTPGYFHPELPTPLLIEGEHIQPTEDLATVEFTDPRFGTVVSVPATIQRGGLIECDSPVLPAGQPCVLSARVVLTSRSNNDGVAGADALAAEDDNVIEGAVDIQCIESPKLTRIVPRLGPRGGGTRVRVTADGLAPSLAIKALQVRLVSHDQQWECDAIAERMDEHVVEFVTPPIPQKYAVVSVFIVQDGAVGFDGGLPFIAHPPVQLYDSSPLYGPTTGGTVITLTGSGLVSFDDSAVVTFNTSRPKKVTASCTSSADLSGIISTLTDKMVEYRGALDRDQRVARRDMGKDGDEGASVAAATTTSESKGADGTDPTDTSPAKTGRRASDAGTSPHKRSKHRLTSEMHKQLLSFWSAEWGAANSAVKALLAKARDPSSRDQFTVTCRSPPSNRHELSATLKLMLNGADVVVARKGLPFEYHPPPTISAIDVSSGPASGETTVNIIGQNLAAAEGNMPLQVRFTLPAPEVVPKRRNSTSSRRRSTDSATTDSAVAVAEQKPVGPQIVSSVVNVMFTPNRADKFDKTMTASFVTPRLFPAGIRLLDIGLNDSWSNFSSTGFTFVAYEEPRLMSIDPLHGPAGGGCRVTITGSQFPDTGTSKVRFSFLADDEDVAAATAGRKRRAGSKASRGGTTPAGGDPMVVDVPVEYISHTVVRFVSPRTPPGVDVDSAVLAIAWNGRDFDPIRLVDSDGKPVRGRAAAVLSSTGDGAAAAASQSGRLSTSSRRDAGDDDQAPVQLFHVFPDPVITALTPAAGPIVGGASVCLRGRNLTGGKGAVRVRFARGSQVRVVDGVVDGRAVARIQRIIKRRQIRVSKDAKVAKSAAARKLLRIEESQLTAVVGEATSVIAQGSGDNVTCTAPHFDVTEVDEGSEGTEKPSVMAAVDVTLNGGGSWHGDGTANPRLPYLAYPAPTFLTASSSFGTMLGGTALLLKISADYSKDARLLAPKVRFLRPEDDGAELFDDDGDGIMDGLEGDLTPRQRCEAACVVTPSGLKLATPKFGVDGLGAWRVQAALNGQDFTNTGFAFNVFEPSVAEEGIRKGGATSVSPDCASTDANTTISLHGKFEPSAHLFVRFMAVNDDEDKDNDEGDDDDSEGDAGAVAAGAAAAATLKRPKSRIQRVGGYVSLVPALSVTKTKLTCRTPRWRAPPGKVSVSVTRNKVDFDVFTDSFYMFETARLSVMRPTAGTLQGGTELTIRCTGGVDTGHGNIRVKFITAGEDGKPPRDIAMVEATLDRTERKLRCTVPPLDLPAGVAMMAAHVRVTFTYGVDFCHEKFRFVYYRPTITLSATPRQLLTSGGALMRIKCRDLRNTKLLVRFTALAWSQQTEAARQGGSAAVDGSGEAVAEEEAAPAVATKAKKSKRRGRKRSVVGRGRRRSSLMRGKKRSSAAQASAEESSVSAHDKGSDSKGDDGHNSDGNDDDEDDEDDDAVSYDSDDETQVVVRGRYEGHDTVTCITPPFPHRGEALVQLSTTEGADWGAPLRVHYMGAPSLDEISPIFCKTTDAPVLDVHVSDFSVVDNAVLRFERLAKPDSAEDVMRPQAGRTGKNGEGRTDASLVIKVPAKVPALDVIRKRLADGKAEADDIVRKMSTLRQRRASDVGQSSGELLGHEDAMRVLEVMLEESRASASREVSEMQRAIDRVVCQLPVFPSGGVFAVSFSLNGTEFIPSPLKYRVYEGSEKATLAPAFGFQGLPLRMAAVGQYMDIPPVQAMIVPSIGEMMNFEDLAEGDEEEEADDDGDKSDADDATSSKFPGKRRAGRRRSSAAARTGRRGSKVVGRKAKAQARKDYEARLQAVQTETLPVNDIVVDHGRIGFSIEANVLAKGKYDVFVSVATDMPQQLPHVFSVYDVPQLLKVFPTTVASTYSGNVTIQGLNLAPHGDPDDAATARAADVAVTVRFRSRSGDIIDTVQGTAVSAVQVVCPPPRALLDGSMFAESIWAVPELCYNGVTWTAPEEGQQAACSIGYFHVRDLEPLQGPAEGGTVLHLFGTFPASVTREYSDDTVVARFTLDGDDSTARDEECWVSGLRDDELLVTVPPLTSAGVYTVTVSVNGGAFGCPRKYNVYETPHLFEISPAAVPSFSGHTIHLRMDNLPEDFKRVEPGARTKVRAKFTPISGKSAPIETWCRMAEVQEMPAQVETASATLRVGVNARGRRRSVSRGSARSPASRDAESVSPAADAPSSEASSSAFGSAAPAATPAPPGHTVLTCAVPDPAFLQEAEMGVSVSLNGVDYTREPVRLRLLTLSRVEPPLAHFTGGAVVHLFASEFVEDRVRGTVPVNINLDQFRWSNITRFGAIAAHGRSLLHDKEEALLLRSQTEAALRIQRLERGRQTRHDFDSIRARMEEEKERRAQEKSATAIQRHIRGRATRKDMERIREDKKREAMESAAARTIQAFAKGVLARVALPDLIMKLALDGYLPLPEGTDEEGRQRIRQRQKDAATKLQAVARGRAARKKMPRLEEQLVAEKHRRAEARAAIRLQSQARGWQVRKRREALVARKEWEKKAARHCKTLADVCVRRVVKLGNVHGVLDLVGGHMGGLAISLYDQVTSEQAEIDLSPNNDEDVNFLMKLHAETIFDDVMSMINVDRTSTVVNKEGKIISSRRGEGTGTLMQVEPRDAGVNTGEDKDRVHDASWSAAGSAAAKRGDTAGPGSASGSATGSTAGSVGAGGKKLVSDASRGKPLPKNAATDGKAGASTASPAKHRAGKDGLAGRKRAGKRTGKAAPGADAQAEEAGGADVGEVHMGIYLRLPGETTVLGRLITPGELRFAVPELPGVQNAQVYVDFGRLQCRQRLPFRFVAAPTLEDMTPHNGPVTGGTVVRIRGRHFVPSEHIQLRFFSEEMSESVKGVFIAETKEIEAVVPPLPVFKDTPYLVHVELSLNGVEFTRDSDETLTFTYYPVPSIDFVRPDNGCTVGVSEMMIKGDRFYDSGIVTVRFKCDHRLNGRVYDVPAKYVDRKTLTISTPAIAAACNTEVMVACNAQQFEASGIKPVYTYWKTLNGPAIKRMQAEIGAQRTEMLARFKSFRAQQAEEKRLAEEAAAKKAAAAAAAEKKKAKEDAKRYAEETAEYRAKQFADFEKAKERAAKAEEARIAKAEIREDEKEVFGDLVGVAPPKSLFDVQPRMTDEELGVAKYTRTAEARHKRLTNVDEREVAVRRKEAEVAAREKRLTKLEQKAQKKQQQQQQPPPTGKRGAPGPPPKGPPPSKSGPKTGGGGGSALGPLSPNARVPRPSPMKAFGSDKSVGSSPSNRPGGPQNGRGATFSNPDSPQRGALGVVGAARAEAAAGTLSPPPPYPQRGGSDSRVAAGAPVAWTEDAAAKKGKKKKSKRRRSSTTNSRLYGDKLGGRVDEHGGMWAHNPANGSMHDLQAALYGPGGLSQAGKARAADAAAAGGYYAEDDAEARKPGHLPVPAYMRPVPDPRKPAPRHAGFAPLAEDGAHKDVSEVHAKHAKASHKHFDQFRHAMENLNERVVAADEAIKASNAVRMSPVRVHGIGAEGTFDATALDAPYMVGSRVIESTLGPQSKPIGAHLSGTAGKAPKTKRAGKKKAHIGAGLDGERVSDATLKQVASIKDVRSAAAAAAAAMYAPAKQGAKSKGRKKLQKKIEKISPYVLGTAHAFSTYGAGQGRVVAPVTLAYAAAGLMEGSEHDEGAHTLQEPDSSIDVSYTNAHGGKARGGRGAARLDNAGARRSHADVAARGDVALAPAEMLATLDESPYVEHPGERRSTHSRASRRGSGAGLPELGSPTRPKSSSKSPQKRYSHSNAGTDEVAVTASVGYDGGSATVLPTISSP